MRNMGNAKMKKAIKRCEMVSPNHASFIDNMCVVLGQLEETVEETDANNFMCASHTLYAVIARINAMQIQLEEMYKRQTK